MREHFKNECRKKCNTYLWLGKAVLDGQCVQMCIEETIRQRTKVYKEHDIANVSSETQFGQKR